VRVFTLGFVYCFRVAWKQLISLKPHTRGCSLQSPGDDEVKLGEPERTVLMEIIV